MPRVLLALDTASAPNRAAILGAARAAHRLGPWRLEIAGLHGVARDTVDGIDGVIGMLRDEAHVAALRARRIPAVNMASVGAGLALPTVTIDEDAIGVAAAEHLLGLGLRAFVACGERGFPYPRIDAYVAALSATGRDGVRVEVDDGGGGEDLLAALAPLPRPLGIFVRKDLLAQRVLAWLRGAGWRVPEDAAVVAVDNDAVVCEICDPPLSSVALPGERIGEEAAGLLARLMLGAPPPLRPRLFPPLGVVARRSSDLVAGPDAEVSAALRHIRARACSGLSVPALLRELPVSRRTLEQRLRAAIGRSPAAEIRRVRMDEVRRLLAESDLLVRQIAARTGFGTGKRLSAAFERAYACSPLEYRRQVRGA